LPSSNSTSRTRRTSERRRTPSFVCELPLRVPLLVGRKLAAKLEAARQVYNACLGEALRRLGLVRQSRWFTLARALPRTQKEARQAHFSAARSAHGFSDAALQQYAIRLRSAGGTGAKSEKTWIGEHLGAHEVQALASRAYRAANEHLLGRRGRPRFKGKGRFRSVEGKGPGSSLRWTDGCLVVWGDLALKPMIHPNDPVVRHALCSRVKYVRIVRRRVRLRTRWYAQLVCEGRPYRKPKHRLGMGVVGVDIGPSTVGVVSASQALLTAFCPEVEPPAAAMRRLQRHIDLQRRANNPDNYLPDGRVRPGPKRWHVSRRQHVSEERLAETHRRLAAARKTSQGRLANRVLAMGDVFQIEKVSYRAFQRAFGRSVGLRAPGVFVERLRRKAENAGGRVVEFSTRTTALSQVCHCGRRQKKPLRQRWHECPCGVCAQRDLYSAFLARFVVSTEAGDLLCASQAADAWAGAEPLLRRAAQSIDQPARGPVSRPRPRRGQSGLPAEGTGAGAEAGDAVAAAYGPAVRESPGKAVVLGPRTPGL
jgi:putative transposase